MFSNDLFRIAPLDRENGKRIGILPSTGRPKNDLHRVYDRFRRRAGPVRPGGPEGAGGGASRQRRLPGDLERRGGTATDQREDRTGRGGVRGGAGGDVRGVPGPDGGRAGGGDGGAARGAGAPDPAGGPGTEGGGRRGPSEPAVQNQNACIARRKAGLRISGTSFSGSTESIPQCGHQA